MNGRQAEAHGDRAVDRRRRSDAGRRSRRRPPASGPRSVSFIMTAAAAPESASTEPTDRSMSPLAITKVRPTASRAISVNASRIANELSSDAPEIRPQRRSRPATARPSAAPPPRRAAPEERASPRASQPRAPAPRRRASARRRSPTPPRSRRRRRRRARAAAPTTRASTAAADRPRLDQHRRRAGSCRGTPGTAPRGNCAIDCTSIFSPPTSTMWVIGTPSRSTLSISTDERRAQARAEHPPAPAGDRRRRRRSPRRSRSAPRPARTARSMPLSCATFISPAMVAQSAENR